LFPNLLISYLLACSMTPSNIQIQKAGAMAVFYAEIHARF
jgi:hypothetical protein